MFITFKIYLTNQQVSWNSTYCNLVRGGDSEDIPEIILNLWSSSTKTKFIEVFFFAKNFFVDVKLVWFIEFRKKKNRIINESSL